jgi:hypothetical protein
MIVEKDIKSRDLNIEKVIGRYLLFAHGHTLRPPQREEPPPAFANSLLSVNTVWFQV